MKDYLTREDIKYIGLAYEGEGISLEIFEQCPHIFVHEGRLAYRIKYIYKVRKELIKVLDRISEQSARKSHRFHRTLRAIKNVWEDINDIEAWHRNYYGIENWTEVRRKLEEGQ